MPSFLNKVVAKTFQLTTSPTSGYVLTSDASGNASWTAPTGGTSAVTVSDTAPSSPATGALWYDSTVGKTFIWYDSFWVETGGGIVGPTGPTGATGGTGATGSAGAAATVAVGTVTTGAAGSSATVTNAGTSSAAVLNFAIPQGAVGATGTAATITVGTVTTGAAGSSATVTNAGTSSAATFNFSIPQGAAGTTGATGDKGGVKYNFSTTTTNADPGSGAFRYNNSTIGSVTAIYLDNVDASGTTQTAWYSGWTTGSATIKGQLVITGNDGTTVNIFNVTGVTANTGYYTITVQYVSGTRPVTGTDHLFIFSPDYSAATVFTTETARGTAITSPVEGQPAYITASPTSQTNATGSTTYIPTGIQTIYNGSAWICISEVGALTTASGTLATTGSYTATLGGSPGTNPSVTIATGTRAIVYFQCSVASSAAMTAQVDFAVSGASTISAGTSGQSAVAVFSAASAAETVHGTVIVTGLTAGVNTFTLNYQTSAATATFSNRRIIVKAIT